MKRIVGSLALACLLTLVFGADFAVAQSLKDAVSRTGFKGGLIVHVGCGDGSATVDLYTGRSCLVQGLDANPDNVELARKRIKSAGMYGKVSVDLLTSPRLPYIDNLVNVLIVEGDQSVSEKEILRVLVPKGVALIRTTNKRVFKIKPASKKTDEWTHYLHGPDNNAVSQDSQVSYPSRMQWVGLPEWTRNHNYLNSYSAVVSSGGRVFYVLDEAPPHSINLPSQWSLIARDAHNGIVLWKKAIASWEGHMRRFRSGPTELPRRLVASGDRVYVTLGYGGPLSELDAATGEVVRVYENTEGAHEIIFSNGILYLVAGEIDQKAYKQASEIDSFSPQIQDKRIMAINAKTGKKIWDKHDSDTHETLPTTLCVDKTRVFFHSPKNLVCLDRESGKVLWKSPRAIELNRLAWSAPTLVVYEDVVLSAEGKHSDASSRRGKRKAAIEDTESAGPGSSSIKWTVSASPNSAEGGELIAFNAKDGKELWRCPAAFGYTSPPNLFVVDGLVWVSAVPGINTTDMTEGRDPFTGEVKRTIDTEEAFDAAHHHRCYRDKATENFLLLGRTGVEFVDLETNDIQRHYWIRGTCQYGVMPANGLLYLPGHSCGCYIQSKLNGFWAIASEGNSTPRAVDETNRLEKGPAFKMAGAGKADDSSDWPMLRRDPARSACTETSVPEKLELRWKTQLGGAVTSPVIAGNRLVVALPDTHSVAALDTENGNPAWTYTTGARIDSPPALYKGLAIFGSHDGYVYCLRLSDGELVWRFRAAPVDERTVAFGHIESVWPVIGSVLVYDDKVYCTAGRTSYLDDGITLFLLDPKTGKELGRNQFYSRDPETGKQPDALLEDVELPGTLPDILTVEGDSIFMRDKRLDAQGREQVASYEPHLYSSAGLLNDKWWHRTTWIWGERAFGRASGWAIAGRYRPSGRNLVPEGPLVYGYKFNEGGKGNGTHVLFCADKQVKKVDTKLKNNNAAVVNHMTPDKVVNHWSRNINLSGRAMIKAGGTLYLAGPASTEEMYFDDEDARAVLAAFNADDGKPISRIEIASQPVFDGMAAAKGRIYLSLVNGEVVSYGGAN